jgi:excisionase family DNA binding protein
MQGNQAQAEETWLTFREVCDRLRMAPATVRKIIRSGDLEASRVGSNGIGGNGEYRIKESALASLMERRKVQPAKAS